MAEVCSRVRASRGREIKDQPGNPDINKLPQHARSGLHYHLTTVFHRSLPEDVVFKAKPRASPDSLLWSSSCISNHQGLLLCLLNTSWSLSSLHCEAAVATGYTVGPEALITRCLYIVPEACVSQGLEAIRHFAPQPSYSLPCFLESILCLPVFISPDD